MLEAIDNPDSSSLSEDAYLVADEGYACSDRVLKPYSNPLSPEQRAFNSVIKSSRLIIENAMETANPNAEDQHARIDS